MGSVGCRFLRSRLPALKKVKGVDLVVCNGENSADGNGNHPRQRRIPVPERGWTSSPPATTPSAAAKCMLCSILVRRCCAPPIIRGTMRPAAASSCMTWARVQVGIVNLMGVVYLDPLDNPFDTADRILGAGLPKITVVDFHAEATGEKKSLAYYLDGRVSAVFGTHTHVQTADEQVLPQGTGYLSDLGMTGPVHSVLGVKPELTIRKMRRQLPVRFETGEDPCEMDCALFDVDEKTGKTRSWNEFR